MPEREELDRMGRFVDGVVEVILRPSEEKTPDTGQSGMADRFTHSRKIDDELEGVIKVICEGEWGLVAVA